MSHHEQHPLGSGFDASSTARDVLAGIDLTGRTAVVTGGYSGLGLETTRALVAAGARVVVPARRAGTARDRLAGLERIDVVPMDLADVGTVRAASEDLIRSVRRVDLLVCAAGVMACPERRVGPGWESQLATNHLGHVALVEGLRPLLAASGARVVVFSSAAHHLSDIRWDDLHFERGYDKWLAYGQAKTANSLFAVDLDAVAAPDGVRAFALHPGAILTDLQRDLPLAEQMELGWVDATGALIATGFKTPEQGAATGLWAATSPLLQGRGGLYLEDCDVAPLAAPGAPLEDGGVQPYAVDPDSAARLGRMSRDLVAAG